jgi:cell division protein FtsQ
VSGPLIDLNGRVRDRAREARQSRVRLLSRLIVALTVVGVLGYVATASPLLSVKKVLVTGNRAVATDTITKAAAVLLGQPLAQVDAASVSKRVGGVPGVGRGDVALVLPDTVTIKVTERAVAFVVAVEGGFAWIDGTGMRFNLTPDAPAGVPRAEADVNDKQLLADVATVVGALPARMTAKVDHVAAPTRDSIVIVSTDGAQIIWGSGDASVLKGQIADGLLQAQSACKKVDVSSPSHPTTHCNS